MLSAKKKKKSKEEKKSYRASWKQKSKDGIKHIEIEREKPDKGSQVPTVPSRSLPSSPLHISKTDQDPPTPPTRSLPSSPSSSQPLSSMRSFPVLPPKAGSMIAINGSKTHPLSQSVPVRTFGAPPKGSNNAITPPTPPSRSAPPSPSTKTEVVGNGPSVPNRPLPRSPDSTLKRHTPPESAAAQLCAQVGQRVRHKSYTQLPTVVKDDDNKKQSSPPIHKSSSLENLRELDEGSQAPTVTILQPTGSRTTRATKTESNEDPQLLRGNSVPNLSNNHIRTNPIADNTNSRKLSKPLKKLPALPPVPTQRNNAGMPPGRGRGGVRRPQRGRGWRGGPAGRGLGVDVEPGPLSCSDPSLNHEPETQPNVLSSSAPPPGEKLGSSPSGGKLPPAPPSSSSKPKSLSSQNLSTLVPPAKDLPKRDPAATDKAREHIVTEILTTERAYVSQLEQLLTNYRGPLTLLAQSDPQITEADIKVLFGKVHLILPINQELLKSVEERVNAWSPTQKLGDVFVTMAHFLKMYNDYSNNYKSALQIYAELLNNAKFVETIEECKQVCVPPMNLESLLITPIQRIPRYDLLLKDLVKHTDPSHIDYEDLKKSVTLIKEVANHINTDVKRTENLQKLAQASSKGAGFRGLMKAHRQLQLEGVLVTLDNKGHKEKLHFFLFNDMLVFANKSEIKKQKDMTKLDGQWPIYLVWAKPTSNSFQLIGPTKTFTISGNEEDHQKWINEVNRLTAPFGGDERTGFFNFGFGSYEGSWKNGQIHGTGTYTLFGSVYTGQWENGLKSGKGTLCFTNGDVYTGEWENDKQNGYGVLTFCDGSKYDGEWKDATKHGQGVFTFANSDTYCGTWKEDQFHGQGKLVLSNGTTYEGYFEYGLFNGVGTLTTPNGKQYTGEWQLGQRDGKGTLVESDGSVYEGSWKQGMRHGIGTYQSERAVGVKYSGNWEMGRKEGQGTMYYIDNSIYEGMWKHDLPHGKGQLTTSSGDIHRGMFKAGKLHGQCNVIYQHSGAEYVGKFVNGMKDGKSTISRVIPEEQKISLQNDENIRGDALLVDKLHVTYNGKDSMAFYNPAADEGGLFTKYKGLERELYIPWCPEKPGLISIDLDL